MTVYKSKSFDIPTTCDMPGCDETTSILIFCRWCKPPQIGVCEKHRTAGWAQMDANNTIPEEDEDVAMTADVTDPTPDTTAPKRPAETLGAVLPEQMMLYARALERYADSLEERVKALGDEVDDLEMEIKVYGERSDT